MKSVERVLRQQLLDSEFNVLISDIHVVLSLLPGCTLMSTPVPEGDRLQIEPTLMLIQRKNNARGPSVAFLTR